MKNVKSSASLERPGTTRAMRRSLGFVRPATKQTTMRTAKLNL